MFQMLSDLQKQEEAIRGLLLQIEELRADRDRATREAMMLRDQMSRFVADPVPQPVPLKHDPFRPWTEIHDMRRMGHWSTP